MLVNMIEKRLCGLLLELASLPILMPSAERLKLSPGTWVAIGGFGLMMLGNMFALIWGAATLSNTVDAQGQQLRSVVQTQQQTVKVLSDIEARLRVLENEHDLYPRSGQ